MYRHEQVAEKHFHVALKSGPEWMCRCLKHEDSSASLQFNVDKGLFVCFSCGWTGNVKSLMRYLGERYEDTVDVSDVLAKLDALEAQAAVDPTPKVLPESVLKRYSFPTDYWTGRGFTDVTIRAFDLGYDPLDNIATIPVRDVRGRLIGVIQRRLSNDDGPKYMYPKHFPRSISMFGSWLVAKSESFHAVLVEGSLDAIAVWQAGFQGLAQYGSSLSMDQVRLLQRLGIGKITLAFDNDAAGFHANHVALGMPDVNCLRCERHFSGRRHDRMPVLLRDFDVSVVRYTRGMPKDPGGFADSPDQLRSLIDSARRIV